MKALRNGQGSKMVGSFKQIVVVATAVLALGLSACTKSKETKSMVSPNAYVPKADFEGKTFSLVRGIEEADSNNVVGAIPGFSQDYGFVTVRITETELQLIEVFNPQNKLATQSIVASYAIKDHFDIQREENDFKETTHRIVENRERPWNLRQFMRVDFSRPTNEKSKLSSSTDDTSAPTENVVQLSDLKKEADGHLSWLTEFSAAGGSFWWGVESNSRVVARTHLMPVKQSDFQRINYREKDFQKFGYFYTRQSFENPEKGFLDSELEDNTFAIVHNVCEPGRTDNAGKPLSCSTNKIVWHLSKGFAEKYKDVTRRAVREWNDAFKKSLGRSDDVVVLDESKEVDMVDPRYNTLAYYGAKSPGGLLGVAQWASNPVTGQILAARATVYEDGIRGTLGWVDDIITLILNDEEVRKLFLATDEETQERLAKLFSSTGGFKVQEDVQKLRMSMGLPAQPAEKKSASSGLASSVKRSPFQSPRYRKEMAQKLSEPVGRSLAKKEALMKKAPELFATAELDRIGGSIGSFDDAFGLLGAKRASKSRLPPMNGLENLHDIGNSLREERARMINQAHSGVHGAELVEEAALRYIRKILAKYPNVNDFKAQVSAIKSEVDVMTFYTTMLHEMGHTFGLRHNFHGSADAPHYHPEYQRLTKQMEQEASLPPDQKTVSPYDLHPYMFSSIMDYGGDFYSQVGGLGPYDIAAIKYGYNRSIDKEQDPVVKAGYKFCTDHQVNDSILCRRFDKGRNVSEITFNLIEDYHQNWILSHFRRDRATFERRARSYPMAALTRYFVPVRQVMDEFLYSLIDAKDVAAGENECGMEHWRKSVDAGEIVNVCDPLKAERVGVDATNLATFEAGLFGEQGLLKNPMEYTPYGLADLVFANSIAKQFFTEVLGSTEPGTYLAEPVGPGKFALQALPEGGNLDEHLAEFASERGLPTTPEFVGQLKNFVGRIEVGRYGKPFVSESDESGPFVRQKNIGAFWDKYVAMIALGIKDIGVEKYYRRSMTGNAYAYPQTTDFARSAIKAMITQKDRILTIPFKTPRGIVPATVEPSLNLDVKAIGTVTALVDFVSDSDESIADSLRVCSLNEQGCRAGFGQKTVEFTTASGQDVFRSVQTLKDDSIAFDLLTEAAALDKERKNWVQKQLKASDTIAGNIMKITELKQTRASLQKSLEALEIEELKEIIPAVLSDDEKVSSLWNITNLIATKGEQIPLFLTLNLTQQAGGALGATMQVLGQSIEKLDPNDECKEPEAPLPPAIEGGPGALPTITGLRGMGAAKPATETEAGNRRANNRFGNLLAGGARLNPGSPLLQAVPGSEVPAEPPVTGSTQPEKPAVPEQCVPIIARRKVIVATATEFQNFAKEIGDILNGSLEIKVAPLRVKRATDELARAETNIRLIRRVSKATGLE
jgi:hypothetical protein